MTQPNNEFVQHILDKDVVEKIANIDDFAERVYAAAKMYAEAGFYVLPLRPNDKRLPPKSSNINYGSSSRNLVVIDKWFHPQTGRFVGYNIALACGRMGGIFVVDIDKHGDKDGFVTWDLLSSQYPTPPTLSQSTPNHGKHLIFNWFEGGIPSTDKLGVGLDTRGGKRDAASSHIVVFPSEVNGVQYRWDEVITVCDAPEWIKNQFNANNTTFGGQQMLSSGNRGNENITQDDELRPLSDDELLGLLNHINVDDLSYENWIKVGMAIHRDRPESGLELWDNWSARGSRYQEGECSSRWAGFNASEYNGVVVTMGTLVHMAKQFGWQRPLPEKEQNELDTIVSKINETCFINAGANGFKVCVESPVGGIRYLSRNDLVNQYANQSILIDGKMKNPATLWLAHENRRELHGFKFDPSKTKEQSEQEDALYNTFRGFPVAAKNHTADLIQPYLNFVKQIICDDDQDLFNWVMDWVADIFQNPANPKGTALVLVGDEGTGKGVFASMIQPLLGRHFIKDNGGKKISGRFNDFLEESIVVFADEMTSDVGKKAQQTLKAIITGDELLIEGKGVDARAAFLVARIIIAGNDYEVIKGEKTSRRYLSLAISNKRINDHRYFEQLIALRNDEQFQQQLMHYLLNRSLPTTHHLRKAPTTKLLQQQKIANMTTNNDILSWVYTAIDTHSLDITDMADDGDFTSGNTQEWPTLVSRKDLKDAYDEWALSNRKEPYTAIRFYKTMRTLGFIDQKKRVHNKTQQLFEVPTIVELQRKVADYIGVDWNSIEDNA